MKVARWQLWYEDGSSSSGTTFEEWEAAPREKIIYGMWFYSNGTSAHVTGLDLYWVFDFGDGLVFAHDSDRDGLLRRLPWVKFGCWTTAEKYEAAQAAAVEESNNWLKEHDYKGCCG